jgi:hypothetical protein
MCLGQPGTSLTDAFQPRTAARTMMRGRVLMLSSSTSRWKRSTVSSETSSGSTPVIDR